jgi:hypothetical protein
MEGAGNMNGRRSKITLQVTKLMRSYESRFLVPVSKGIPYYVGQGKLDKQRKRNVRLPL